MGALLAPTHPQIASASRGRRADPATVTPLVFSNIFNTYAQTIAAQAALKGSGKLHYWGKQSLGLPVLAWWASRPPTQRTRLVARKSAISKSTNARSGRNILRLAGDGEKADMDMDGIRFLDHMLHAWAKHAGRSLRIRCCGDLASG